MKKSNDYQAYGLSTVITMIVGIVVGAGIFFKSDDILKATGGSFKLGVLIMVLGAMGIIFGSLSLSELAMANDSSGGAMAYFEDTWSKRAAGGFGLFQLIMYLPSVPAVVAWVAAIYTFMIFNVETSLEMEILLAAVYLTLFCLLNVCRRIWGGYLQNLSTGVKLIPLAIIALAGIFLGRQNLPLPSGVTLVQPKSTGFSFLTALAPMAFSYDGWIIAANIAPEVKNPRRNMPLALVLAPLFILAVYLLYFTGVVRYAGESYILTMGDDTIHAIATSLFGPVGGKVLMIFVLIAVLGVVNGIVLGGIRMPQALAERGMFPEGLKDLHPRYQVNVKSGFFFYFLTLFWLVLHYFIMKYDLLGGRDASEIAIVFCYTTYILLYIRLIQGYFKGTFTSRFRCLIAPILASIAAFLMIFGSILSSPGFVIGFLALNTLVFFIGTRLAKEG